MPSPIGVRIRAVSVLVSSERSSLAHCLADPVELSPHVALTFLSSTSTQGRLVTLLPKLLHLLTQARVLGLEAHNGALWSELLVIHVFREGGALRAQFRLGRFMPDHPPRRKCSFSEISNPL